MTTATTAPSAAPVAEGAYPGPAVSRGVAGPDEVVSGPDAGQGQRIPRPGPLTADAAAWIRANAWTAAMRKTYAECPGFYTTCACQGGTTTWCRNGQCDRCHRATPLRDYATVVAFPGNRCAHFAEPYAHLTDVSATGPRYERLAMVWLADRVCRWTCPHSCHASPAPVQLDLFSGAA